MTSGYGFKVISNEDYEFRVTNGTIAPMAASGAAKPVVVPYHFGDMLINPFLRMIGAPELPVFTFNLNTQDISRYMDQHLPPPGTRQRRNSSPRLDLSLTPPTPQQPQRIKAANIPENEMWGVFFEQVYYTGLFAHQHQLITVDDLEACEPFLFIGLPSLTLLNLIVRSVQDPTGLVFIDLRRIEKHTCPANFLQMFDMLIETKRGLQALMPLQEPEMQWIQKVLLFAGADRPITADTVDPHRQDEMRRVFSFLAGVASQLTQQAAYKENFMAALTRVETDCYDELS